MNVLITWEDVLFFMCGSFDFYCVDVFMNEIIDLCLDVYILYEDAIFNLCSNNDFQSVFFIKKN
jgi:hypothetical protein